MMGQTILHNNLVTLWDYESQDVQTTVDSWYQQGQLDIFHDAPYIFGIPDAIKGVKRTTFGKNPLNFLINTNDKKLSRRVRDI